MGRIKLFDTNRGFGFITISGDRGDVFFHKKNLLDKKLKLSLKAGDRVEFDTKRRGSEQMMAVKIARPGGRAAHAAKHMAKRILRESGREARGAIEFESQKLSAVKLKGGLFTAKQFKRERDGEEALDDAAVKKKTKKE